MAEPLAGLVTGITKALRPHLLTTDVSVTQARVLGWLTQRGPLRIGELTVLEQVAQPTMTTLIDRMQRLGLVSRRSDRADGRVVRVRITAAGSAAFADVVRVRTEAMSSALAELSADDRQAISVALPALHRLRDRTEGTP